MTPEPDYPFNEAFGREGDHVAGMQPDRVKGGR